MKLKQKSAIKEPLYCMVKFIELGDILEKTYFCLFGQLII